MKGCCFCVHLCGFRDASAPSPGGTVLAPSQVRFCPRAFALPSLLLPADPKPREASGKPLPGILSVTASGMHVGRRLFTAPLPSVPRGRSLPPFPETEGSSSRPGPRLVPGARDLPGTEEGRIHVCGRRARGS